MPAPPPADPPAGETLYRERRFELRRCAVPLRGGGVAHRGLVVHPGAVVILPLLDDGRVVLIANHRWQIGHPLLELPAGTLDPGESPIACAARELREETGFEAAHLDPGPPFFACPGISTERMHPFTARGLRPVPRALEPDERIDVTPMTEADLRAAMHDGRIADAKTLAVLGRHLLARP